jgi:hypothetical protein
LPEVRRIVIRFSNEIGVMGIRDTMVDPLLVVRPVLGDCADHVVPELLWEPDMSKVVDQDGKVDIG